MIKKTRRILYNLFKFFLTCIYYIKAIIFISIHKNNYLNKNFYILHHWSFGWQVIFTYLIYIYSKRKKNKIKIINFVYKRNNPYMTNFFFKKKEFFNYQVNTKYNLINKISYDSFLLALNLFPNIKKKLITNEKIFKYLRYKNQGIYQWDFIEEKLIKYFDFSWFDKLLAQNNFKKNIIQKEFKIYSKRILDKRFKNVFKNKSIGSIAFRDQYTDYKSDSIRQKFKPGNYIPAIKWLIKNKNFIFVNHNKNFNKYFNKIKGVINLSEVTNSKKEFYYMNLFLYHINDLFISTLSGSHLFTVLFDKKIMLGDVWPLSTGTPGNKAILLPVNYFLNNKRITLNKILVNYPHIFLGSDRISYKKKIQIGPNSKNQILQMVQEKKLRKIKNLPKNSLVFYRKNLFCVV